MVIKLRGYITEDGEIKIYDMPKDHPVGEVEVRLLTVQAETAPEIEGEHGKDNHEELTEALLDFKPATLGEILDEGLTGGWEHIDIDSVEWLDALRRARREKRGGWTIS